MQTVLATFDDKNAAQQAVDQLKAQGFSHASVHLQPADSESDPSLTAGADKGFLAGVGQFFSHLFGSDDRSTADTYSEAVRRGSTVVAVDAATESEVAKVRSLLHQFGSVDVDSRAANWKSRGWSGFDPNSPLLSDDEQAFERDSVPVVQEEIAVGKRAVDVGGLRVVKRMSETPVSEIVKLRQERATIERRPVDRPATEADFANFREGTFEIREMAEEAVVGKTARVVEEVTVGKQVAEHADTVSDTVRRTEVEVERIPGSDAAVNPAAGKKS
jgi:uncharacterized protein (TIGR02271 family)